MLKFAITYISFYIYQFDNDNIYILYQGVLMTEKCAELNISDTQDTGPPSSGRGTNWPLTVVRSGQSTLIGDSCGQLSVLTDNFNLTSRKVGFLFNSQNCCVDFPLILLEIWCRFPTYQFRPVIALTMPTLIFCVLQQNCWKYGSFHRRMAY